MTHADIGAMVEALGSVRGTLLTADADDKAAVYRELGLELIYDPTTHSVRTVVDLGAHAVGLWNVSEGDLNPHDGGPGWCCCVRPKGF